MRAECRHRRESAESQRDYLAHVHAGLFGNRLISCNWGGLHSRFGGQWDDVAPSDRLAETGLESIYRARAKHWHQARS
jgi:hypothetical protein